MKLNYGITAIILSAFAIQAAADQQEPAYWMKSYPGADAAKVQACLAKGTEWEECMEGK